MKLIFLLITIYSLGFIKCGSHPNNSSSLQLNDSIPDCIKKQIEAIKSEPVWNPPAQVEEYLYNGNHLFLFSSNCCDQYNILYDSECNMICAPSGGYTGKGDGKCADFSATAKHIKLIWKDSR